MAVAEEETYVAPDPPPHLHKAGREAWADLATDLELEDGDDLQVLSLACEALDRVAQARRVLRNEGITVRDKQGNAHQHPAVAVEARSATRAATLIKQLQTSMMAFQRLELAEKRAAAQEQARRGRITRHAGGVRRHGG